jgi:enediyne biosynthesis protein E4
VSLTDELPSKRDLGPRRFLCAFAISLCAIVAAGLVAEAQGQSEGPLQAPQSGMSTAAPRAAVKDEQFRPIIAGGFVDGAPVVFTDITHAAGLDRFHHKSGTPEKSTILETPGSGVALLDYDQDGWLDIYLVNGSTFPALAGKESAPKAMLLRNNHDFSKVMLKPGETRHVRVSMDRRAFSYTTSTKRTGRQCPESSLS